MIIYILYGKFQSIPDFRRLTRLNYNLKLNNKEGVFIGEGLWLNRAFYNINTISQKCHNMDLKVMKTHIN